MLDYKDIIIKHYALHMSGRQIASALGVSKSGVNEFLNAFDKCTTLQYPLPEGITNYGIAELVYGNHSAGRKCTVSMTVRHIIPSIPRILFSAKFCCRRMHPKNTRIPD